jgi:hypothetical protein
MKLQIVSWIVFPRCGIELIFLFRFILEQVASSAVFRGPISC